MAGCGGGGVKSDGMAGSGAGTAAAGGGTGVGAGGAGGIAGGAGGMSGGLPDCAIKTRPNDPLDVSPMCNTVTFDGDTLLPEMIVATDAGIASDGGAPETPAGGTILDGDYTLVRYRSTGAASPLRRTIRLFDGGTFIEWLNATGAPTGDGGAGATVNRFNTSQQPSHAAPFMLTLTCADGAISTPSRYDYTATGNELVLFVYLESGATLVNTYRRNCAR
jgi:hypothetical protein